LIITGDALARYTVEQTPTPLVYFIKTGAIFGSALVGIAAAAM
jgi:hypothetical protein